MLGFKVGKTYKDTDGNDKWEFVSRACDPNFPYLFKNKANNEITGFYEQKDKSVTYWIGGNGIKIPFVEEQEKERDWEVGEKYDCYNTEKQKISKAELLELDESRKHAQFCFRIEGIERSFGYQKGEILCLGSNFVIFKNGIPEELRKRLEKGEDKITNKQKCFQKEQVYKSTSCREFIFKKRVKTKDGLFAIFENKEGWLYFDKLYKVNNIECILLCSFKGTYLCADESIRNEDTSKAVRVKE